VCDLKHTNKEELETHIRTCEIYVSSVCSYRHKSLSDLKNHCKTKHTSNTIININKWIGTVLKSSPVEIILVKKSENKIIEVSLNKKS
jgi:hypothetical protein